MWVTDVRDHVVMKLDKDANIIMTLGSKGQAGIGMNKAMSIILMSLRMWLWTARAIYMWGRGILKACPKYSNLMPQGIHYAMGER